MLEQSPDAAAEWVANGAAGAGGVCNNMIVGYRYEIIYSKIGFNNNLQNYIAGVRKVPIT